MLSVASQSQLFVKPFGRTLRLFRRSEASRFRDSPPHFSPQACRSHKHARTVTTRIVNLHLCIRRVKAFRRLIFLCVLLTSVIQAQEVTSTELLSLIDQLKHSDTDKRRQAANDIGKIKVGAAETVPYLIEALKDPDRYVRQGASSSLEEIEGREKEMLPQLVSALKNPDSRVREAAVDALGQRGEGKKGSVPYLVQALKDTNARVRYSATFALLSNAADAKQTVPHLIEALKDSDDSVRAGAANALAEIGGGAKEAAPYLIKALNDPEPLVQTGAYSALGRIGDDAPEIVPQLIEASKDQDADVRRGAVMALADIGNKAKDSLPRLVELLKDPDKIVRKVAATALWKVEDHDEKIVPYLIDALKDPDDSIRESAAYNLENIGEAAKEAVPHLIAALKDPYKEVRRRSAYALGKIGRGAKEAIPHLLEALKDPDEDVRRGAAAALEQFSAIFVQDRDTEFLEQMRTAADIMWTSSDPIVLEYAGRVRQANDFLELLWWEQLKQWVFDNPVKSVATGAYPTLLLLWVALLRFRPLWILHINEALAGFTDVKLPEKLGGFNVAPRYLILVGFFHYRPRVLDAWVARHVTSAREVFFELRTVREREIYVQLPVVLGSEAEANLSPGKLRPVFSRSFICLQIWGEGGSGKTTIACRLAQWAMSPQKESRLGPGHLMLPVLIEQNLSSPSEGNEHPLFRAIKQQVRVIIGEEDPPPADLLRELLKKRRVLTIIDGFSEMSEASRAATLADVNDLSVNAVVFTSRTDEHLGGLPKTEITPLRVRGNRLATFMEAYLTARKRRDLFDDDEFFEACRRLSLIVGDRDVTALLAKLYAEQMIAIKEGTAGVGAPESIPELMLSYLNDLCRGAGPADPDIRVVHHAAKGVAWECLRNTLKPTPARREDVLLALGGEEKGKPLLVYLEEKLKIIQTVGAGRDQIRFALDPLAEYLAGMHLVDMNGEDERAWRGFLAQVDEKAESPKEVEGFLLAVRDCCLAREGGSPCLRVVANEVAKKAGVSPEVGSARRSPHSTPKGGLIRTTELKP